MAKYWNIGCAERDMTPKKSGIMGCGFATERFLQGVIHPLKIQCLYLGPKKQNGAFFIALDVCSMDRVFVGGIKNAVKRRFHVQPSSVIIAVTHTHWAPAISNRMIPLLGTPNPWYIETLEDLILSAVTESIENAKLATLQYIECQARIGAKRRCHVRNGKITFIPNDRGFYDQHTPILFAQFKNSADRIALVSHACHPTASGNIKHWSADYPGAFREKLTQLLGKGAKVIFAMGCGADAKVLAPEKGTHKPGFAEDPKAAKTRGIELAEAIYEAICQSLQENENRKKWIAPLLKQKISKGILVQKSAPSVSMLNTLAQSGDRQRETNVISQINKSWARQLLDRERDLSPFQYHIQTWKLGSSLTLCALEGEVCSAYGPKVRALIKDGDAMIVAYAGAIESYIPDRQAVIERSYEGFLSSRVYGQRSPFTRNIEKEFMAILKRVVC